MLGRESYDEKKIANYLPNNGRKGSGFQTKRTGQIGLRTASGEMFCSAVSILKCLALKTCFNLVSRRLIAYFLTENLVFNFKQQPLS